MIASVRSLIDRAGTDMTSEYAGGARIAVFDAVRSTAMWAVVLGAVGALVIVLTASIHLALVFLGCAVALILYNRVRVVVFVMALVPTLSLVRRIAAGPSGYTESDPLILLPIFLVVVVVAVSATRDRIDHSRRLTRGLAIAVAVGVLVTVVLRGALNVDGIFFAGLIVVPMLFAVVLSSGRMPPVWDAVVTVLPAVAVFAGTYGIYQFFFLPSWDKAWMLTSRLTSIGQAEPQEVRVFGASESPGPYALFLGLVLTLCLAAAVMEARVTRRMGWIALGGYLAYPLLLSGVRSALLGVTIAAVVLTLVRARGFARILLLGFLAAGYFLLTVVVARFGGSSTILTADRYTSFSAEDDSLVARLNLLSRVGNPLQYIVGNPNSSAADNLYVDTLVRYGLVPALALVLLVAGLIGLSIKNLIAKKAEAASLCVVFIATMSLFGPIFNTLFGLFIGVVFGTVMAVPERTKKSVLFAPRSLSKTR